VSVGFSQFRSVTVHNACIINKMVQSRNSGFNNSGTEVALQLAEIIKNWIIIIIIIIGF
jgi:hypothetical protein